MKRTLFLTLRAVRDMAVRDSGGGYRDDFIPPDARIRLVCAMTKEPRIEISWSDDKPEPKPRKRP